jgi:hypothetical protein
MMIVSGQIEDYDTGAISLIANRVTQHAAVTANSVRITVDAASVLLTINVTAPDAKDALEIRERLHISFENVSSATLALGIQVE